MPYHPINAESPTTTTIIRIIQKSFPNDMVTRGIKKGGGLGFQEWIPASAGMHHSKIM